jgi:hypothetical protein
LLHEGDNYFSDGAVGIQESLAQGIEGSSAREDEVVAVLDLREEEAMLTTSLFPLFFPEEGSEAVQPLAAAGEQIVGGQRISEFLQPLGVTATQEGVGGLLKVDVRLLHTPGEPVMLVETEACRKREVGREANEHSAPVAIVHVEVVLNDPALGQLQVPAIVLFVPGGDENAGWFSCLEDDDQLVGLGMAKVRFDKLATTFGGIEDGGTPISRNDSSPHYEIDQRSPAAHRGSPDTDSDTC